MRPPRRSTAAALLLSASLLLATSACTSGGDDDARVPAPAPTVTGIGPDEGWPRSVDPASTKDTFWVVWTDIVDNGDGAVSQLEPTIEKLGEVGYQTLPWDPACQTGAEEQLAGLTGYADPIGVGLAFPTAQDAGIFDNLYDGTTVSVTQGTYTCATSS